MRREIRNLFVDIGILFFDSLEWGEDFFHLLKSLLNVFILVLILLLPITYFFLVSIVFINSSVLTLIFISCLWFLLLLLSVKYTIKFLLEKSNVSLIISLFFSLANLFYLYWVVFLNYSNFSMWNSLRFPLFLNSISINIMFFSFVYSDIKKEKRITEELGKKNYDHYKINIYYNINDIPDMSGIYKINDVENKRIYIGKAKNLRSRISNHLGKLKNNSHSNNFMQEGYNKGGDFNFEILEIFDYFDYDELGKLEHVKIREYNSTDVSIGYNKVG